MTKPVAAVATPGQALQNRNISMSNALARGAQGLLLSQKRIIAMALACTNSKSQTIENASQGGWSVQLRARDYADLFEVSLDSAYEQLKEGADRLLKTIWTAHMVDDQNKQFRRKGQWLSLAEYRDQEGRIDVTFHPHVAPHLLELRSQFTTYKLKQAYALRSIYAWRLQECMESWRSTGRWLVSVEEFEVAMDAPDSCRGNFGNLKKRVIEPAIAELASKARLYIEMRPTHTRGRKILDLAFEISKKIPESDI